MRRIGPTNNAESNAYIVGVMCDRSEPEVSDITKKFFEPGCGRGNILVEVLSRRLRKPNLDARKMLIAVSNIYGLDINHDDIITARQRLLSLCEKYLVSISNVNYRVLPTLESILQHNIFVADFLARQEVVEIYDWKIKRDCSTTHAVCTLQEIFKSASIGTSYE